MDQPTCVRPTAEIIEALVEQVGQIERGRGPAGKGVISSGSSALDGLLPDGGLRRGTLVEWLAQGRGGGAATLALMAAREAAREGGALVVVDRGGRFYPPAAVNLGLDLAKLIVIRPRGEADRAWALDQALRCPGVAAVWCVAGDEEAKTDERTLRRWQLAVEASGVLGLLVRGEQARHEPSWAEVRLWIEPLAQPLLSSAAGNRHLRVELMRSRGGQVGKAIELEISQRGTSPQQPEHATRQGTRYETRTVHLASQLAAAKTGRRSRRA